MDPIVTNTDSIGVTRFLFVRELEKSLLLSIGGPRKVFHWTPMDPFANRFYWSHKFYIRSPWHRAFI